MPSVFTIPGAVAPIAPRKGYQLRRLIEQAAASAAAVDLMRELALGVQPERPLTMPRIPAWAGCMAEAR